MNYFLIWINIIVTICLIAAVVWLRVSFKNQIEAVELKQAKHEIESYDSDEITFYETSCYTLVSGGLPEHAQEECNTVTHTISYADAIKIIMNHLGIEFKYVPETKTPSKIEVTKKGTINREDT